MIRKHIIFKGWVQGVGFRYRLRYSSERYNVTGWVKNLYDGSVEAEMQGREEDIDMAIKTMEQGTFIRIEELNAKSVDIIDSEYGFEIIRN